MTEEKIKCPKCGTENNNNDIYCKECGKDLTKKEKIKKDKKPSSALESLSYLICFSIFAFVIGFLVCLKFGITLNDYNDENVFKQIYNAIEVVGFGVSICIGIVTSFSIIAYIRINKKLNDISMQLLKQNNNKD